MFKRATWMATGVAVGLGSAWWVERKVREQVARYVPERVANDLAASARRFGTELKGAVAEGRDAMRAREDELRQRVRPQPRRRHAGAPRLRVVNDR